MIEILDQSTETCLVIRISGKVTGEEYQQFLTAVNERIKHFEEINLVLELSGFDFYGDFESAKQDVKFTFEGYRRIQRAAFVGDQKWIEWFTRLIGPFTKAEEMHFPADQFDAACSWACGEISSE